MKKAFVITLGIAITAGILSASFFYWHNLRGIWPAIREPASDITESMPIRGESPDANGTDRTGGDGRAMGLPLRLPEGFSISIYAKDLGNARVLARDPAGNLLLSIPAAGKVVALPDANDDGVADSVRTVASGLNRPHGLAFQCKGICRLYIAESHRVGLYDYDANTFTATLIKNIADLPDGGNHFSRTLLFMPAPDEDTLLISVGSSCNVCIEKDWRRAKILAVNVESGEVKEFAKGLRNAVFMAVHPKTSLIWVTEMGRDLLGDDTPPDEINIVVEDKNYGWPVCYGKNIHDTAFDKNTYIRNPCMEPFETPSHIDIPAHSAPLGLAFVPGNFWPEGFQDDLLVSLHGSWNRSVPDGYKIVRYILDADGKYLGEQDFITGWLDGGGRALGRPVDIIAGRSGEMFISDDKAGVVYRLAYGS